LGYLFLLLATTVTLMMPEAFIPALTGIPFFNLLTLSCLAASLPRVLALLTAQSLIRNPITAGVLGINVAVVLSHASNLELSYARTQGIDFVKIVIFYLILVANLDTPSRLKHYLRWLALVIATLAGCSLLQYYGVASLSEHLEPTSRGQDYGTVRDGQATVLWQLRGVGFFSDPNDVSLALVAGLSIALSQFTDFRGGISRLLWLIPFGILAWAFPLTYSRGGMIALLVCLLSVLVSRFGPWRTIPVALTILPALMFLIGGRQTSLNATGGTAQSRIQLWALGLSYLRAKPLFGIGGGLYHDFVGQEAHNSYVHSFVELGLLGGTCFLGIFSYAIATLYRLGSPMRRVSNLELRHLRPYVLGAVAAYAAGMLSLTRVYIMPTYLFVGLATSYIRVAKPCPPAAPLDGRLIRRSLYISIAFLILITIYIRIFARWGGG
jgi:putative inorganic carbon (hco3(-)) transporter